MSETFRGKTALITGGSSGIGFELAKLFMKDDATVILVASDAAKLDKAAISLESLFGRRPMVIVNDLARPEAPREIFDELQRKSVSTDILVNNAGFGIYGKFSDTDLDKALKMLDVNTRVLVSLTRLFLPGMLVRRYGRVLNVASTAGFQAIPIESLYAASKAFVLIFSEGLADEVKGSGVSVTCLCPGATNTPFFTRGEIFPSKMLKRSMMDGATVARVGFRGLKQRKALVIAGLSNRLIPFFERFAPRSLVTKLARKVVE